MWFAFYGIKTGCWVCAILWFLNADIVSRTLFSWQVLCLRNWQRCLISIQVTFNLHKGVAVHLVVDLQLTRGYVITKRFYSPLLSWVQLVKSLAFHFFFTCWGTSFLTSVPAGIVGLMHDLPTHVTVFISEASHFINLPVHNIVVLKFDPKVFRMNIFPLHLHMLK